MWLAQFFKVHIVFIFWVGGRAGKQPPFWTFEHFFFFFSFFSTFFFPNGLERVVPFFMWRNLWCHVSGIYKVEDIGDEATYITICVHYYRVLPYVQVDFTKKFSNICSFESYNCIMIVYGTFKSSSTCFLTIFEDIEIRDMMCIGRLWIVLKTKLEFSTSILHVLIYQVLFEFI